ncbi:MAG TPA: MASE1 domain-containing protein, partial [Gemmatimonadales bacterium]|nr:MASE1 domain-containing protein [Gemmatimonadales bacterium]
MSSIGGRSISGPPAAPTSGAGALRAPEVASFNRVVTLAITCAALYYAAAELGLALRFPGQTVSAIWPANAVLLAALLLTSPRSWWIPLLAIVPAHFAAYADTGYPDWRLAWQIGFNWTLTISTAAILRALALNRHPFRNLPELAIYLLVAVAGVPALVSLLAPNTVTAMLHPQTQSLWLEWRSTYLSNATGFLVFVPAIVLWVSEGPAWLRRATPARCVEAALIGVGLYLVCTGLLGGSAATPALLYVPLPLLLWAAARFGAGGVTSALFLFALSSTVCAIEGRGPFTESLPLGNVSRLQMFLFAVALPLLMLAVLIDERARIVMASKSAERALRESYAQVQDLAKRLIGAQEEEHTRIARDLHDDLGQQLAAVAIGLSRIRQRLPADPAGTVKEVARLQAGIDQVARALRSLSHELHPGALRHVGLGVALRRLCREFADRHGTALDFDTEGELRSVAPEVALCLFRVAQEVLRNVAEHAGAREVNVRLGRTDGALRLVIGDDGRGFDREAAAARAGLGLVTLDERVRAVGGHLVL